MGAAISPLAMAADKESNAINRLDSATEVLQDMTKGGDKGIPQDLMSKAECVIVIPNMKKGGFIWGAKYGRGYAACRQKDGTGWSAPAGVRVEGGSFGLQIGGTDADVVLLVMNDNGMKHILEDKFTLGANANVSAGPVGRDATAQTDAALHAEILSYSRARGAFAGMVLEGSTLRPDKDADKELYGEDLTTRQILIGQTVKTPAAAAEFERALRRESNRKG